MKPYRSTFLFAAVVCVFGLLALLGSTSCELRKKEERVDTTPPQAEIGDLEQIRERGTLRVLLPKRRSFLPRKGPSLNFERELAEQYAREIGVEPVFVYVESRDRFIPALLEGRGDLIAANMTATDERRERVSFTVPVTVVREQLVSRTGEPAMIQLSHLEGRRVAVRRSSSFWKTMTDIQVRYPGLEIEEVPENVETEEIIHGVAQRKYDLTVADSNLVETCLEYRDDIKSVFDLTEDRPIAWGVRPQSGDLLKSLDRFLTDAQLSRPSDELHVDDLDGIRERRVLRLATRNSAATYFMWRGELMGFEYDLVRSFAKRHGLRLEVVVPRNGENLLEWLAEGRVDIVGASLTPSEQLVPEEIDFSRPYNFVSQVLVTRAGDTTLNDPQDLAGRTVWVRPSSNYWGLMERLQESGVDVKIAAAPEIFNTEEIIGRVAEGEYDLTVADSHVLSIELSFRDDVKAAFALEDSIPLSWAMRGENSDLRAAVDEFIEDEYRGLFYNVIYRKYFKDHHRIRARNDDYAALTGGFSPYDELIKKYADLYEFDWRLIASLMYQESRFQADAESFAGAQGLMQVLPNTGMMFGFTDLTDPELSIHAGVRYLDWVRDLFETDLSVQDRMWFTLAGYNAGPGHVRDARRLAQNLGMNPNQWFGNVENAMLLLSRPQYASLARHGYCRCSEPVNYVREIRSRYNAYVNTLGI